jgi:hypothetical protein
MTSESGRKSFAGFSTGVSGWTIVSINSPAGDELSGFGGTESGCGVSGGMAVFLQLS